MSLNTAVSGIKAAQAALNVISNDLANANTVGFRAGTQLFSDVYADTGDQGAAGIGVRASVIEHNFNQGGVRATSNPLDLAVQGQGFFIVSHDAQQRYTRDGSFHIDPDTHQLLTAANDRVLGFNKTPGATSAAIGPLTLSSGNMPATATTSSSLTVSLDTKDPAIATAVLFDPANPLSYDESTSLTTYDSLGNANRVELYFRRAGGTATPTTPDQWQVYAQPVESDGTVAAAPSLLTTLQFDSSGNLTAGANANLAVAWGGGAGAETIATQLGGTTLANQDFTVGAIQGNGFPPGAFQGVTVGKDGSVAANYSNGQKATVAQIALATFTNNQGLAPNSNNLFSATAASGQASINIPGSGGVGKIASGQLEQSNVNLSQQLVNLITEQEAYQANTKSIQTGKQNATALLQV